MKKIILILMTIVALFAIMGCPYSSVVPIDEPNEKLDKKMLGEWVKGSHIDKENPEYYVISNINGNKFNINKFEYNGSDSAYNETKYLAHISRLDDNVFLNMQKDGKGNYYLYKIKIGEDQFVLYEVTDNIDEKFTSSEELKKFVKQYMHLSFFYNKEEEAYFRR